MEQISWASLPDHILVNVFTYLSYPDRLSALLTCRHWLQAFRCPYLWHSFHFHFYKPRHKKLVNAIYSYGRHMRNVRISLYPKEGYNRSAACDAILALSNVIDKKLTHFSLNFIGENPMFYSGREFLQNLNTYFVSCKKYCGLLSIDLSGFGVTYDDCLLDALAVNNPKLEYLNLQNKQMVCKASRSAVLKLIETCRNLKDIRAFNCMLSDEALEEFSSEDRVRLTHLGIKYHREQLYIADLTSAAWSTVTAANPSLRVSLVFDYTCEIHTISTAMKSEIPVIELRLESYTMIFMEVSQAAQFYSDTLEKLVVFSRPCTELDDAIVRVSQECIRLRSLHVFCVLKTETISEVFRSHPQIKRDRTFTLKDTLEPAPWATEAFINKN